MFYVKNSASDTYLCLDHENNKILNANLSEIHQKGGRLEPVYGKIVDHSAYFFGTVSKSPVFISLDGSISSGTTVPIHGVRTADGDVRFSASNLALRAAPSGDVAFSQPAAGGWDRFSAVSERQWAAAWLSRLPAPEGWSPGHARILSVGARRLYGSSPIEVSRARVTATDWSVIDRNGALLIPHMSHRQRLNKKTRNAAFYALNLRSGNTIDSGILIGGYYNFFHHFIDYVLNIFSIDTASSHRPPLIVSAADQRFQKECLDLFGLRGPGTIELPDLQTIFVKRLFIPQKAVLGDGHVHTPAAFEACRNFLMSRLTKADAPKKIFISRRKAAIRRAVNEDAAIALCSAHGYVPFILEDMTLADQISLFLRADGIVGLHGAGLAHIAFAPPGCRVIEIQYRDGRMPDGFRNLSRGLNHDFHRTSANHGGPRSTTLQIDLGELRDALEVRQGH